MTGKNRKGQRGNRAAQEQYRKIAYRKEYPTLDENEGIVKNKEKHCGPSWQVKSQAWTNITPYCHIKYPEPQNSHQSKHEPFMKANVFFVY